MSFSSLPVRAQNALAQHNIKTPEDLARKSRIELLEAKNIGPKTIAVLEAFLSARGLALRPEGEATEPVPEWLLTFEARAYAAGFGAVATSGVGPIERNWMPDVRRWWLKLYVKGADISIFGPTNFILGAVIQNLPPRELMARAQVIIDALEIIAPEIVDHFTTTRQEAVQ